MWSDSLYGHSAIEGADMRGRLVTFEGIDGSGKTSVSRMVCRRLRGEGVSCVWTCEPTRSWLGRAVNRGSEERLSAYTEALLFMADRSEHTREIWEHLRRGRNVICDRYLDSTIAYQGARLARETGGTGSDAVKWLVEMHRPFALVPDLTILLRAPAHICLSRLRSRGGLTKFERLAYLRKVAWVYDRLAQKEPRRFRVVDARQSMELVVAQSLEHVHKIL